MKLQGLALCSRGQEPTQISPLYLGSFGVFQKKDEKEENERQKEKAKATAADTVFGMGTRLYLLVFQISGHFWLEWKRNWRINKQINEQTINKYEQNDQIII